MQGKSGRSLQALPQAGAQGTSLPGHWLLAPQELTRGPEQRLNHSRAGWPLQPGTQVNAS